MKKLGLTESVAYRLNSRLLEDKSSDSMYRQRFIDYCKDKIEDLGTLKTFDDISEEEEIYPVAFILKEFRNVSPAYVLYDSEGAELIADKQGNLVFNGGSMSDINDSLMDMNFVKIDKDFYDNTLKYWDDLDLDEYVELKDKDTEGRLKIERELKIPAPFKYNVISRLGGADVEVYNNEYPNLGASTTTMKGDKHVQDYFDIDGLWRVNIVNEDGTFKDYEYVNGWQEMLKILQNEYNTLKNKEKKTEGIQDERLANTIKWLKDSGYEEYKTGDKYTLLVNDTKYDGQIVGAMFYGKSAKPAWHYRFRDMEELDKYLDGYLKNKEQYEQARQERKDKRKLTRDHDIKVGDIFYTSWGYDQTNIDFYEVVAVRGSRIDLRELHQQSVGHEGNYDSVVPATGENRFKDDEIHTVSARADGTVTSLSSFEYPSKWDGKPKDQTDAYSGH